MSTAYETAYKKYQQDLGLNAIYSAAYMCKAVSMVKTSHSVTTTSATLGIPEKLLLRWVGGEQIKTINHQPDDVGPPRTQRYGRRKLLKHEWSR